MNYEDEISQLLQMMRFEQEYFAKGGIQTPASLILPTPLNSITSAARPQVLHDTTLD